MPSRLFRQLSVIVILSAVLRAAESAPPVPALPAVPLEAYAAVGSNFAQNTRIADLGWNDAQFEAFVEGLRATFKGKPLPLDAPARLLHEGIGQRLQALAAQEARAEQERLTAPDGLEQFMKEMTKRFKLQRSDSGLAFGLITPSGGSSRPGPDDTVVVTYDAVAADARTDLPQLSVKNRRVKVADLIPGLAEGVQMMTAQGSALFIVPPDLSYGDGEWPAGVVRGSPLFFTVVVNEIIVAP